MFKTLEELIPYLQEGVAKQVTVGPELASNLLLATETSPYIKQRPVKRAAVREYVNLMSRGHWKALASTIHITEDGTVVDGQHRLKAVALSEQPQDFLLTLSSPSLIDVIDRGRIRTDADILSMRGCRHYTRNRGATLRLIHQFFDNPSEFDARPERTLSILELERRFPNIDVSLEVGARAHKALGGSPAVLCAMHYLLSRADRERADVFFERLIEGHRTSGPDVVWTLREALIQLHRGARKVTHARQRVVSAAFIVKAWNGFVTQRQVRTLRHRMDEPFPAIENLNLVEPAVIRRVQ